MTVFSKTIGLILIQHHDWYLHRQIWSLQGAIQEKGKHLRQICPRRTRHHSVLWPFPLISCKISRSWWMKTKLIDLASCDKRSEATLSLVVWEISGFLSSFRIGWWIQKPIFGCLAWLGEWNSCYPVWMNSIREISWTQRIFRGVCSVLIRAKSVFRLNLLERRLDMSVNEILAFTVPGVRLRDLKCFQS